MKVADIFGTPDPVTLIADLRALGCLGVGGYAYDDDVSAANPWRAAHVDAVKAAGLSFLPIITLRTGTTVTGAELQASLQALGRTSGPVGWDRENTALPPIGVAAALVQFLRNAGYGPMTGYYWTQLSNGGPPAIRSVYTSLDDFAWWGDTGTGPNIPLGWDAVQYGQEVGPSGTTYDVDIFTPGIFGTNVPPTQRASKMWTLYLYDAAHGQQHFIEFVNGTNLYHKVYDETAAAWYGPWLIPNAQGLNSAAGLSGGFAQKGSQLQVFTQWANTNPLTGAQFYCPLPVAPTGPAWGSSSI